MPVITILGLPDTLADSEALKKLIRTDLPEAVAGIPVLGLLPKHVSAFAPRDLLQEGLGTEIIAHIDDLLERPGRTVGVKNAVAGIVKRVLQNFAREHLPQCALIEVSTQSLDTQQEGLAVWRREGRL